MDVFIMQFPTKFVFAVGFILHIYMMRYRFSPDVYKNFMKDEAGNCRFSYESKLKINYKDPYFVLVVRNKAKNVILKVIKAQFLSYKEIFENQAAFFHLKRQSEFLGGGIEQDNWFAICSRLIDEGKKFWDDYRPIWAEYFIQKGIFRLDFLFPEIINEDNIELYFKIIKSRYKLIILYGNCQIYKIREMLACEESIRKK